MVRLVVVSSTKDKFDFDVDENMTVDDTRAVLQELSGIPLERLRMTFRGQVLYDGVSWRSLGPLAEGEKLFIAPVTGAAAVSRGGGAFLSPASGGTASATVAAASTGDNATRKRDRDEFRQSQQMEPLIESMANNPGFVDMMLQMSPEMRRMVQEQPQLARELRDPDTLRTILRAQFNPDARRELDTSMNMQLAQIGAIPGGNAMLERHIGSFLRDEANWGRQQDRGVASEEHSQPKPGQEANNEAVPNPWAPRPQAPPRGGGGAAPFGGVGGMPPGGYGGAAMPGMRTGFPPSNGNPLMGEGPNPFEMFNPFTAGLPFPFPGPTPPATVTPSNASPSIAAAAPAMVAGPSQGSRPSFDTQKAALRDMGFDDEALIEEALGATNGDIDAAVGYIAEKQQQDAAQQGEGRRQS